MNHQRRSRSGPGAGAVAFIGARPAAICVVAAVSGIAWVWSWYTMYLEIHRWKHVSRSFRFNPGPPIPGTTIRPKPGRPLKTLYACTVGAPVVFVAAAVTGIVRTHRKPSTGQRANPGAV